MENRNDEHQPSTDKKNTTDVKNNDSAEEIKNAHAVGLGSMGRSDEALPDKPEEQPKIEPGDY